MFSPDLLGNDHSLYRAAIAKVMRDFERIVSVKEALNGKLLFDLIKEDIPDVVILDLEMPEWDGAKTCERIRRDFPEVKVIIVSMHNTKAHINHLIKEIGAHAFVSKTIEMNELEKAIYAVVDKGIYRNKTMDEALKSSTYSSNAIIPKEIKLTAQENRVLQLLCQGHTNRQISLELQLSENTTRNHKVSIMRKFGVKNTAGIINFAHKHGLIDK